MLIKEFEMISLAIAW